MSHPNLAAGTVYLDVSPLASGMYILQVSAQGPDDMLRVVNRQKFMIAR